MKKGILKKKKLNYFFPFSISATHEKGFILYLSSSHMSFLLILKIYHLIWPFLNTEQRWSYYKKLFIFVFSITCLALMAYFYYRHIIHCDSMGMYILKNLFVQYDSTKVGRHLDIVENLEWKYWRKLNIKAILSRYAYI